MMENDRDIDQILMNVRQAGGGIVSLLVLSAQMEMKLLVFLSRMAEKALVSSGILGRYKTFMKKTEGKFHIYNIPVTAEQTKNILRLQELETKLEQEKNPIAARSIRKEIGEIQKEIPELSQLDKLGITHYVMPKLNGGENTLQVAVDKKDVDKFKTWFVNHLNDKLSGGEMLLGELQTFTEGNYGIFNMPFEGDELTDVLHDFNVLGINYTVLPDLKAGDGYTQIAVANKDQGSLDGWFRMWKEKQMQEGRELGDYRQISQEAYLETAEMDAGDYIAGTDRKYKEADAEFSQSEKALDVPYSEPVRKEMSEAYRKMENDPEYVKITINKESLVDHHSVNQLEKENAERYGMFLSRVPGTFGENQRTLILPKDRVYEADNGRTYIGFLHKKEKTMVQMQDGKIAKLPFDEAYQPYHKVERGFKKVEDLIQTDIAEKAAERAIKEAPKKAGEISSKAADLARKTALKK